MTGFPEANAIVYCEGAFNTTNGKTAHGLVRFTKRYNVICVIDSRYAGRDAGEVIDGKPNGIPIVADLESSLKIPVTRNLPLNLVVGLAPDGGRISGPALVDIKAAIQIGLNIDCGLHDYLSDNYEFWSLASAKSVKLRDIRKPKSVEELHFFTGKIEQVTSKKIAVLGTDSAIGKRTTAWILVKAMEKAGYHTQMIGTGQTAWMQGAKYSIILDSIINDFVSGEIEHAVWSAWNETRPDFIIIEGQGSLLNPAYPGGFEILAAGRPDMVILQHAPARKEYDGFPGYPLHPIKHQVKAIELISGKPVVAITINHEELTGEQINKAIADVQREAGLPTFDVLRDSAGELVKVVHEL
jgi:uncharacterized NAD-dependent epimerase/dehydratase family protein